MLTRLDCRGVEHTERVTEIARGVGENPQHRDVDAHGADCTASPPRGDQVALRSSEPMASNTAARVSTGPETGWAPPPGRSSSRRAVWSYSDGSVVSMKRSTTSMNRSGSSWNGKCPERSKISNWEPGIAACAIRAWLTGTTTSSEPQIICTGTDFVK